MTPVDGRDAQRMAIAAAAAGIHEQAAVLHISAALHFQSQQRWKEAADEARAAAADLDRYADSLDERRPL